MALCALSWLVSAACIHSTHGVAAVRYYSLEMISERKRGYKAKNSVLILTGFFGVLLPSFVVEIVLLSPEGTLKTVKPSYSGCK